MHSLCSTPNRSSPWPFVQFHRPSLPLSSPHSEVRLDFYPQHPPPSSPLRLFSRKPPPSRKYFRGGRWPLPYPFHDFKQIPSLQLCAHSNLVFRKKPIFNQSKISLGDAYQCSGWRVLWNCFLKRGNVWSPKSSWCFSCRKSRVGNFFGKMKTESP